MCQEMHVGSWRVLIFHLSVLISAGFELRTFSKVRFNVRSSILGPVEVEHTTCFTKPMKSSWAKQWWNLLLYSSVRESMPKWHRICNLGTISHRSLAWWAASQAAAFQQWHDWSASWRKWSPSSWVKYLRYSSVILCHSANEVLTGMYVWGKTTMSPWIHVNSISTKIWAKNWNAYF